MVAVGIRGACRAVPLSALLSCEIIPGACFGPGSALWPPTCCRFECNSEVPILQAGSTLIGNSPDHGLIGTTSLGGPREPAVRPATVASPMRHVAWGTAVSDRKSVSATCIR